MKSLARAGEVEGLVEASRYSERYVSSDGTSVDTGAAIREEAVLALGDTRDENARWEVVDSLAEALADPVDRVRCAAVLALYRLEEDQPLADAVARLSRDGGKARDAAMRALLALRAPGSGARLAAALVHRPDELALRELDASFVATLIEEEGTPDGLRAVIEMAIAALSDERRAVTVRAEQLLKEMAPDSLDGLVQELRYGSAPDRAAALLGGIKDSRALEPLVEALGHQDPLVRRASCAALGELRDPAVAESLLLATRDPVYEVRAEASAALDRLGTAAIAVSVATLLGPLIAARLPEAPALAINGHAVPDGNELPDRQLVLDMAPSSEGGFLDPASRPDE